MQWMQDLTKDIRIHQYNNYYDNEEIILPFLGFTLKDGSIEMTACNRAGLQQAIDQCRTNGIEPKTFLEIGVCRLINHNYDNSSTGTIIKNVPSGGIYLGVDLDDRTFLDNPEKGIYTLRENSSNYDAVVKRLNELGVTGLDFIMIDGWHSINQVYKDWEFSKLLNPGGVIGFHDTTAHPGPALFIRHLNKDKWVVFENLCPDDFGFGYCYRKV